MKRIMIEVAYDGTSYCGWQIQPNGITVEEVLNRTISDFLGEKIQIMGASRTDSGVHALGNVAVFDTETTIPPDRLCYALNGKLPDDIRSSLCFASHVWYPENHTSNSNPQFGQVQDFPFFSFWSIV